ncbi:TPA: prefoldin subunit beta [Candidatus Bathyarchaeota archaeon]|nr:prefoldin subunit beta [Candidatus Bathyarchaeota archaeon]
MGEERLPPQIQEQLLRLQQMQQTLQAIVTQKQQLELELAEAERAISELEKINDETAVYKSAGTILLEADRQSLLDELKERKELLNTRVKVLGKQEERARAKIKEVQQRLQERLKAP